ncbi:lipopolysaccharide biosynthesis protein [Blastomonas aquatica]|uniref:Lipopolysaccharide biosynthesis protein n=1 Tax=Blastomonas aquatica TaxID=1510276 RepID=A0ABQ1JRF5_9SPHN|nr:lipopolysaccharide biosynthesis protein [Blastomonas aquatica]
MVKGAAMLGGARVIVNLTAFASTLVLARLLTPQDFGLVALVIAVSAIVAAITDMSLNQALIQLESPSESSYHTAFTLNLLRSIGLALLMLALGYPMALIYHDDRLVALMAVVAVITATAALDNPKLVVFQRNLQFKQAFAITVTERMVASLVAVGLAVLYRSYWALVLGTLAAAVIRVALSYAFIPYRPRLSLTHWRQFLAFSIWLSLGKMVQAANLRAIPLVVGAFLPAGAVGQYSVGERVAAMPIRESIGTLQSVLFPAYARMRDDVERLQRAYLRAQGSVSLFASPTGLGLAAIAAPLVPAVLGAKWIPAVPIVQAVAVASAVMAIQNALPLAMALGQQRALFMRNVRVFAIQLPMLIAGLVLGRLSPLGGLGGLAVGLSTAAIVNTSINLWLVRSISGIGIRAQIGAVVRPMLAAIAMAASLMVAQEFLISGQHPVTGLWLCVILVGAGAVIYAVLLGLLNLVWRNHDGAEAELFNIIRRVISSIRSKGPSAH